MMYEDTPYRDLPRALRHRITRRALAVLDSYPDSDPDAVVAEVREQVLSENNDARERFLEETRRNPADPLAIPTMQCPLCDGHGRVPLADVDEQ